MTEQTEMMLRGYGALPVSEEMTDTDRALIMEIEALAHPDTIYGIEWRYRDCDNRPTYSSELDSYGFFLDKAEAEAFADSLNRKGLDKAREQHESAREGEALAHSERCRATRERQQEHDILKAAGHTPSWKRPADPKQFSYPDFDDEKWLARQRQDGYYAVEEFTRHQEAS